MPIKGNVIDYSIGLRQSAAAAFLLGLFYRVFFFFLRGADRGVGLHYGVPVFFLSFFFFLACWICFLWTVAPSAAPSAAPINGDDGGDFEIDSKQKKERTKERKKERKKSGGHKIPTSALRKKDQKKTNKQTKQHSQLKQSRKTDN